MLLHLHPVNPQPRNIRIIIECLLDGGVVVYPTDTIYGLGCDIFQHKAVERICRIKQVDPAKANLSFIYIRGEYMWVYRILEKAIKEAYAAGWLGKNILGSGFDHDMDLYSGAGAYICGEETGMISSLEGLKGQPKLKPPFPAVQGLYSCPTVVNNVETLCNLPLIIDRGGEWFKSQG